MSPDSPSDPDVGHPLNVLGERLVKNCQYLHEHQGVSAVDILYVLHGVQGQVLLWEADEDYAPECSDPPEPEEDDSEDDDTDILIVDDDDLG